MLSLVFFKVQVSRNRETSLQSINYPLVILRKREGRERGKEGESGGREVRREREKERERENEVHIPKSSTQNTFVYV